MLISICICTTGRAHLRDTLASVVMQELPVGSEAEIVVVDNLPSGNARGIVAELEARSRHPIRYAVEERSGLAFARNRTLDLARGDWLALIDDDETADPGWIRSLHATAVRFDADAVVGSVLSVFEEEPPVAVKASRMYERRMPETGTVIGMGKALTGNALLKGSFVRKHELRFEEAFNTTGGEDSDFFRSLIGRGGRLIACREAIVREVVPRERMTSHYMTVRAIRTGETYARVMQRHGGLAASLLVGVRASANVLVAGALVFVLRIAGQDDHYHYRMLLLRNLGKLRYLCGAAPIEMYAHNHGNVIATLLSL